MSDNGKREKEGWRDAAAEVADAVTSDALDLVIEVGFRAATVSARVVFHALASLLHHF